MQRRQLFSRRLEPPGGQPEFRDGCDWTWAGVALCWSRIKKSGSESSELNALMWADIDLRRAKARIHRKRAAGVDYERTKTEDRTRLVDLLPPALRALKRQREHTFMKGGHVFHNPLTGRPWFDDKSPRETYWDPALQKAGIRRRVPHQTRHTFASMMLSAGESPKWVAAQMGDDLKTVLRHYQTYLDTHEFRCWETCDAGVRPGARGEERLG